VHDADRAAFNAQSGIDGMSFPFRGNHRVAKQWDFTNEEN